MATENDKRTKREGGEDPVGDLGKNYRDDVESIPEADRLQESTMPMAPMAAPFKMGPMAPGGRK